jgi:hypothetical protein
VIDGGGEPARPAQSRTDEGRAQVLAIVAERAAQELLRKVVPAGRLRLTGDPTEALALVRGRAPEGGSPETGTPEGGTPDVAFIELTIADGAGLALVHHIKAMAAGVTIFALATRETLEAGASAVALGGAGLLMLPLSGDEVLSALSIVEARIAERAVRADLERAAGVYSRAAGWMARVAELADCPDRTTAAGELGSLLMEATLATGAAVYLAVGERATELFRASATPALERAPAYGTEADVFEHARRESLLVVRLGTRTLSAGHILLLPAAPAWSPALDAAGVAAFTSRPETVGPAPARLDGLLKLLTTQAATVFALLGERERADGGAMKDPTSSAYSFAYYVDVAGREIDKARRHGRRFAVATITLEPSAAGARASPVETAEYLLKAARDIDVLARIDEHEFHLLMPETDGLGAHACRRRVLARMGGERGGRIVPPGLLVGVATFPHDGQNLSQLLRVARRRAEATKSSAVHRLSPEQTGTVGEVLEALEWDAAAPAPTELYAPRPVELSVRDAAALATTVVGDALRGGGAFVAVAQHALLGLGAAVRAAIGPARDNVTFHAIDVLLSANGEGMEALSVIAEHGAYALIGRSQGGVLRGLHAADPLLADLLAERLGRMAGLRVFP